MSNVNQKFVYSYIALLNKQYFSNKNIFFFVEDINKDLEYELLFERIFKIDRNEFAVISMNGKQNVISAFKDNNKEDNKVRLYIVDGDFDVVLKRRVIKEDCFYYLDKYNIESYLIDVKSILSYLEQLWDLKEEEICKKIDITLWHKNTIESLSPLFYMYMYISWLKIDTPPETVGKGIDFLINNKDSYINQDLVNAEIDNLKQYIINIGIDFDTTFSEFNNEYSNVLSSMGNYICGKCLLHALNIFLRLKCKMLSFPQNVDEKKLRLFLFSNVNNYIFNNMIYHFSKYLNSISA